MKLLFLTDNFPPEVNAPATRTYEHCKEWVKQGVEVTVLTCTPNFPFGKPYLGYKNKIFQQAYVDGIEVIRVWSFMAPNKGFFLRTLDFLSFSIMSFVFGLFKSTDVIMATSPQFFTALSGRALSFWKNRPFILEIRDLWPEQILASTNMKRNLFIKYFEREEVKCYKRANLIVTVTESYVNKIIDKGSVERDKFIVIKNGADPDIFKPLKKNPTLLEKYKLHNKIVVGYIGTHGLSQNLPFIIDCIAAFNSKDQKSKEVIFLFVGEGEEKEKMKKMASDLNINNAIFESQIKKVDIPKYLSLLDISIVPLRKSALYLSVIPSKIFELAAMNIPILLGVDGESRALIEKYKCGVFYEPENKHSFAEGLKKLVDGQICSVLKEGSKVLAKEYNRKELALKLIDKIKLVENESHHTYSK